MGNAIDPSLLPGQWIHAHEEDTAEAMVFRRPTHIFPPSRQRRSFELRPDGSMTDKRLGADDRPRPTEGSWSLVDQNHLELAPQDPALPKSRLAIDDLSADKLVVSQR